MTCPRCSKGGISDSTMIYEHINVPKVKVGKSVKIPNGAKVIVKCITPKCDWWSEATYKNGKWIYVISKRKK